MTKPRRVSALILVALCCASAHAADRLYIQGKVTGVIDGDTLDVGEYRIRLAEIDAPERGQPGGLGSRAFLEAQTFGKLVSVRITDKDRYGRYIGYVTKGTLDVNAFMVEAGWAWRFEQYSKDDDYGKYLKKLQGEAQEKKRGMWESDNPPVPPWIWRKNKGQK